MTYDTLDGQGLTTPRISSLVPIETTMRHSRQTLRGIWYTSIIRRYSCCMHRLLLVLRTVLLPGVRTGSSLQKRSTPFFSILGYLNVAKKLAGHSRAVALMLQVPSKSEFWIRNILKIHFYHIWLYSFMIEIKVVRNFILNDIDIHDQPSRMHCSPPRSRRNF